MPQIRPTKFTDFNDQPLNNGYVYVYKVGESYLDSSALLTLTDADTGAAISNPFRTNEFGYPIDTNSQSVNPIFAEEEWAVRIESLQNVEVKTFPKMIADNFNEDVAQTSVVDATFADLPDAKAANLTAYDTVYVQNETAGWEGTLTGPTTGFYAHKDGTTGAPGSGTSAQFFDSAGNGFTRDDLQRIDEQEIADIQADIAALPLSGYLYGIDTSSSDGDTVDITAGSCNGNIVSAGTPSGTIFSVTAQNISIRLDIANGGNRINTAIANDTTYYIFALSNADGTVVKLAFDTNLDASQAIIDWNAEGVGTFIYYRLIGFALTDATPDIIAFTHTNDQWTIATAVQDFRDAAFASALGTLIALSVPIGVSVNPKSFLSIDGAGGNNHYLVTSPSQTDTAPTSSVYTFSKDATTTAVAISLESLTTNTSGQIRYRQSAGTPVLATQTSGWSYVR